MPRLRKLGKGGRYYACFYKSRQSKRETSVALDTSRKDVAMRKYSALVLRYESGDFDPWNPTPVAVHLTYAEAVDGFIEHLHDRRPRTRESYRYALGALTAILPPQCMLRSISVAHIRISVEFGDVSAATRHHRLRHMKAFFRWALDSGLVSASPCDAIRLPRLGKRVAAFLTPTQLDRLLRAIDADFEMKARAGRARNGEIEWLKDLILVAVCTGMRRGELCNLRWPDVDFETGFLTIRNRNDFRTKSGNERAIPLVGQARTVLAERHRTRSDDGFVFRGCGGGQLDASYASKKFKRYARLARLPEEIRFHSLRHTCASWLVQQGTPLPFVQRILGHSTISVTERYAHLAPDVLIAPMVKTFDRIAATANIQTGPETDDTRTEHTRA